MSSYIPQKGDFVTVTFDPQSGHEQKGRRPALVISNTLFNHLQPVRGVIEALEAVCCLIRWSPAMQ